MPPVGLEPQSQQASNRRPTPQTALQLELDEAGLVFHKFLCFKKTQKTDGSQNKSKNLPYVTLNIPLQISQFKTNNFSFR